MKLLLFNHDHIGRFPIPMTQRSDHPAKLFIASLALLAVLLLAIFASLPIPYRADFLMLYATDLGLVHGIGFFDHTAQVQAVMEMHGTHMQQLEFPYYVYPPWLALSTFFLGWLAPDQAAQLWFVLNFAMVLGAVHLLTRYWPFPRRALAYPVALLFLPTIGFLVVGQFVGAALLGTALVMDSTHRQSSAQMAIGLLLLSVKPHLGAVIALACIVWLLLDRPSWALRGLVWAIMGLLILCAITLAIDPRWPSAYLETMTTFRDLPTFGVCEICSSLSVLFARSMINLPDTNLALWIGIGILVLMSAVIFLQPPAIRRDLRFLVPWAVFATLASIPYLNSYDYILLVVPLVLHLFRAQSVPDWLVLGLVFFAPWVALLAGTRASVAVAVSAASCLLAVSFFVFAYRHQRV